MEFNAKKNRILVAGEPTHSGFSTLGKFRVFSYQLT
jgi:hypothetical protein